MATVPPPPSLIQALPCLSMGTRLAIVFLIFSVLAQGGGGIPMSMWTEHANLSGEALLGGSGSAPGIFLGRF